MKKISFIIPNKNYNIYLKDAVKSIENLKLIYDYEIIIVDYGSLDKPNFINQKKIHLYTVSGNVQTARSYGISKAKFNYICMLDADDQVINNKYFEKAVDILFEQKEIAFVHGNSLMIGDMNCLTPASYPLCESLILSKHHVKTSIIFRKSDANIEYPYHNLIEKWQDWSFAVGLLNRRYNNKQKNEIYYIDEIMHLYRVYNSSTRISSKEVSEFDMTLRTVSLYFEIFEKYYKSSDIQNITKNILSKKPKLVEELQYSLEYSLKMLQVKGG